MKRVALCATIGLGLVALIVGYFTFRVPAQSDCADLRTPVLVSSDGKHEARLYSDDCAGPAYWVTVHSMDGPNKDETEVFLTWLFAPDVSWRDERHLVITIKQVSHFGKNLHQVDGITVVYHIADTLSEPNFRQSIEDYERALDGNRNTKSRSLQGADCA